MKENRLPSFAWSLLLRYYPKNTGFWKRTWRTIYDLAETKFAGTPVSINIHGEKTFLNYGHAYPLFARRFPDWNNPLIEIVFQTHKYVGRPISIADIGAGIGDTVRLINANCPQMANEFYCIEGDPEFFNFLSANLSKSKDSYLYQAMLSSNEGEISSLIRHHSGSSAAQGADKVYCTTLDTLLSTRKSKIDVIKIDVDGLDGSILSGSKELIRSDIPNIIFEWHPLLCNKAGQSLLEHFETLLSLNYTRFIWFDKFGRFSHFMHGLDRYSCECLISICMRDQHEVDWHYDVIALPKISGISEVALAELQYAKHRISRY